MHDSPYTLDERAARAAGAVVRGAELRLPCPVHDSSPETLAIRQGDRAPVWHCHAGCNPVHVREALLAAGILLRERSPSPGPPPRPADDRSPPRWIARVWNRAAPIAGTPADDYLRARGLAPPWPPELRWDRRRRRMLARALLDRRLRALHATTLPGRDRRTYGPVRGAAVRLAAMDGGVLAVAEGIETALAYAALTGRDRIGWYLYLLDTAQHDPLKYEPAVPQAIPEDSGSETGEEVHGWSVIETGQSDGAKWRS